MIDSTNREMACRELVEVVTDYLEGRLPAADRARFEAHLAECEYCAAYVEQLRQTLRTLGRIPEETLSPEARGALLAAFRDWRGTRPRKPPAALSRRRRR